MDLLLLLLLLLLLFDIDPLPPALVALVRRVGVDGEGRLEKAFIVSSIETFG